MKIKTQNLTGKALDWAVQKVLFARQDYTKPWILERHAAGDPCGSASTDWSQGGHIIERERIHVWPRIRSAEFKAFVIRPSGEVQFTAFGPTPLVAAMRCVCLAYLGEEVELPESLQHNT